MNTMTYKVCQGKFEYGQDADIFHGEVLHLNDAVAFQGRFIDKLKKSLADSVKDYLLLCKEVSKEPERPFSGKFKNTSGIAPRNCKESCIGWVELE